jgi:hypothetical protein
VVAVKMGLAPQILTRTTTQHNFKNELIMEALSEQKYTPYLISVNIYILLLIYLFLSNQCVLYLPVSFSEILEFSRC